MGEGISERGAGAVAVAVLEQMLRAYAAAALSLSPDGGPDLVQPVTEVARGSYRFAALHFMEVRVDEFVEVLPVRCSVTVAPARDCGFRVQLNCHTNLEEPEYSYWEFRDFLKGLSGNGYLGCFTLAESPWHIHGHSREVMCYHYRFAVPGDGSMPDDFAELMLGGVLSDILHAATSFFQHFWYYLELDGTCTRHAGEDAKGPSAPSRIIPFPGYRRNKLG